MRMHNLRNAYEGCSNPPILCTLCTIPTAIWKLNAQTHIKESHPSYALPGLPPFGLFSGEKGQAGLLIPKDMLSHLEFAHGEEDACGVPASPTWRTLEATEEKNETYPPEQSCSRKRQRTLSYYLCSVD
jgi:hypothetical protein